MPRLPLFVYANHFANELQTKLDGQNGTRWTGQHETPYRMILDSTRRTEWYECLSPHKSYETGRTLPLYCLSMH